MSTGAAVLAGLAVLLAAVAWMLGRNRRRPRAGTSPVPVAVPGGECHAEQADPRETADAWEAGEPGPPMSGEDLLPCLYAVVLGKRSPGRTAPVAARGHAEVLAATAAVLARVETQSRYTPRRPHLLPQLMRTINDPDASGSAIAAIIARDPTLAGNLLRIANSALYRVQSRPVESIQRAVALVGTDGIRQIIAAALVQPVVSAERGVFGGLSALLWEHTLLSAAAAADHAKRLERDDPFAAQLLGLMQGLGATIALRVLRDQYARKPQLVPDPLLATTLMDDWAAPAARRLALKWELSDRIGQALDEQGRKTDPAAFSPLGRSLRFGQLAGGLVLLCHQGRLTESGGLAALQHPGAPATTIAAIWERLHRSAGAEA